MLRRKFLATLATTGIAGCADSRKNPTKTPTPTENPETPETIKHTQREIDNTAELGQITAKFETLSMTDCLKYTADGETHCLKPSNEVWAGAEIYLLADSEVPLTWDGTSTLHSEQTTFSEHPPIDREYTDFLDSTHGVWHFIRMTTDSEYSFRRQLLYFPLFDCTADATTLELSYNGHSATLETDTLITPEGM